MATPRKTVVITGASSGIGFALAEAYLGEGFNVVANSRSRERLEAAARALGGPENLLLIDGDIGRPETARRLFAEAIHRFDGVNVLVNNAGIFQAKSFVDYTPEDLASLVSTNLNGFVFASQEAAKHMLLRRSGHIINGCRT